MSNFNNNCFVINIKVHTVNFPPVCTVEIYAFGSPHVRESVFQNLGDSGIGENRNPGLWNPEYSSRNSESPTRLESRIQVLLTKTGVQYVQSGIHCMESRIQDCPGFRDGASLGLCPHGTTLTPGGGGEGTRPIFGYG